MKTKLVLVTLATTYIIGAQAQLFSGGNNCAACLGTKRIICQSTNNGTGCFDSLS